MALFPLERWKILLWINSKLFFLFSFWCNESYGPSCLKTIPIPLLIGEFLFKWGWNWVYTIHWTRNQLLKSRFPSLHFQTKLNFSSRTGIQAYGGRFLQEILSNTSFTQLKTIGCGVSPPPPPKKKRRTSNVPQNRLGAWYKFIICKLEEMCTIDLKVWNCSPSLQLTPVLPAGHIHTPVLGSHVPLVERHSLGHWNWHS